MFIPFGLIRPTGNNDIYFKRSTNAGYSFGGQTSIINLSNATGIYCSNPHITAFGNYVMFYGLEIKNHYLLEVSLMVFLQRVQII